MSPTPLNLLLSLPDLLTATGHALNVALIGQTTLRKSNWSLRHIELGVVVRGVDESGCRMLKEILMMKSISFILHG